MKLGCFVLFILVPGLHCKTGPAGAPGRPGDAPGGPEPVLEGLGRPYEGLLKSTVDGK